MRKREIKVTFRLNKKEWEHLKKQVDRCGYSQERYIRSLIAGYIPREMPPLDFHNIIRELRAIGNALNQLAAHANAMGYIPADEYEEHYSRLTETILEIRTAVLLPERIDKTTRKENRGAEE